MKHVLAVGLRGLPIAALVASLPEATRTGGSDSQSPERPGGGPNKARRSLRVLAVLLLAVVLAVAGVVAYVVTRPPDLVSLKVTDGSRVGVISGNLTSILSNNSRVLDFAVTTYANETNGLTSKLILRLHTWTLYDGTCGCVDFNVIATIVGDFAADLRPSALRLAVNQTGPNASLQSWEADQVGTNVSFNPMQSFSLSSGTEALNATIIGEAGKPYSFQYSDYFNMRASPRYNRFLGFQAVVTGSFTPAVDVGILLKIINVPGGIWA